MPRYLDARMMRDGATGFAGGVQVVLPLPAEGPDVPDVLTDPIPEMLGVWHRVSRRLERPAQYVQVER